MKSHAARWATASAAELKSELDGYLREVAPPRSNVRVMWKSGPKYQFGGCNEAFAKDAGLSVSELIGADDFDKRLPWRHQAAKYRRDDEGVVKSGKANLDIIERQESGNGETSWVRVGKAPIKLANGTTYRRAGNVRGRRRRHRPLPVHEVDEGEAAPRHSGGLTPAQS